MKTLKQVCEQFESLSDRDITIAVFEFVLGYRVLDPLEGDPKTYVRALVPGQIVDRHGGQIFSVGYCTSWACAGAIMEKMRADGYWWHAGTDPENGNRAGFWGLETQDGGYVDVDVDEQPSVPRAAAQAALLARLAEQEDG